MFQVLRNSSFSTWEIQVLTAASLRIFCFFCFFYLCMLQLLHPASP
jgi:hypothetical protein